MKKNIFLEYDGDLSEEELEEYAPFFTKEKRYITYEEISDFFEKKNDIPYFIFEETYNIEYLPFIKHIGDYFEETGSHGWIKWLRVFRVKGAFYGIYYWGHDDYGTDVDEFSGKIYDIEEIPTVKYQIKNSNYLKN